MSWLFSQALVAEYSEAICWDGAPSAPLSVMPTPHKFWRNDKTMEPSRLSQFGLTCAVLTDDLGAALLTWFLAGFPARTYPSPETVPVLMASAPASGQSSPASLARYDHASHSLRTAQLSLIEDLTGCSVTLPRWGSMHAGELFQQPTPALPICESASGSWPTPTTQDNAQVSGQYKNPKSGTTLGGAVRMFPTATATATASKGWSQNHNRANTDDRLDYTIEREAHQAGSPGRLNPEFCEWLMGWPIGWTESAPLATGRFPEWQQQHSPSSQQIGSDAA